MPLILVPVVVLLLVGLVVYIAWQTTLRERREERVRDQLLGMVEHWREYVHSLPTKTWRKEKEKDEV